MASFLSNPVHRNPVQSAVNLPLTAQVMSMRQGKYDVNREKLQGILDQYSVTDLLRPEDKEYLASRLSEITTDINNAGNKDLSRSSVAFNMGSKLKSVAADPVVLDAVESTTKYNQFNAQVSKIREKNKDAYSDVNYAYALDRGGYNDYMSGKTNKLGSLNYTPYTDVTKTMLDKVKTFKDLKGDEVIEVPVTDADGTRRIEKRTVKGLTESEILAYMPSILSPDENQQLQINGWGKYRGEGGLDIAKEQFSAYTKQVTENLDTNINAYGIDASNKNLTQEQRDNATKKQQAEIERKNQYLEQLSAVDTNNVASVGGFLEANAWKTNFAQMAGAKTSVEYDDDPSFYAARKLELDYAQEARAQQKLPYEIAKLKKEAGVFDQTTQGAVSLTSVPAEQTDEASPYKTLVTDFNTKTGEMKQVVDQTLATGGVDQHTKEAYQNSFDQAVKSGVPESIAAKRAFESSGMDKLFPEKHAQLIEMETQRNAMASVIYEAQQSKAKTFAQNPDAYMESANATLDYVSKENEKWNDKKKLFEPFMRIGWVSDENTAIAPDTQAFKDFVVKEGGLSVLREKMLDPKNAALVDKFANLLEKSDKTFYNAGGGASLNEDSKSMLNQTVIDKGQGVVTTADIATVTDENYKKKIIAAIPQTDGEVPFDDKGGLTIRKGQEQGTFEIMQSGAKEGVKGIFGTSRTHLVKKGDDLYNLIETQVLNEAQRRGISAANYSNPVKSGNIGYIDRAQNSALGKASTFIMSTVTNELASKVPQSYFLTKETTAEAYQKKLPNIDPIKINQLTELMSVEMNKKFDVEAAPINGQYTTRVTLKKGGSPLLLSEADTGKRNMDKELLLYVKQYPQILIGEALLEYLQQSPTNIDKILQRLQ